MNIFEEINQYVQQGYLIQYYIVNQIENGYGNEVKDGDMPLFTYTVYIDHKDDEMVWCHSVDTLDEGFKLALEWLKKYKTDLDNKNK